MRRRQWTRAQALMEDKFVIEVENVVDQELKRTNASLCSDVETSVNAAEYTSTCEDQLGLEAEEVDLVLISLQSGKRFELRLGAPSSEELVPRQGSYLLSLGVKYAEYAACIVRTMLIDPVPAVTDAYAVALHVQEQVIGSLKHGAKFNDIFCAALQFVELNKPDLVSSFQRNVGWVMGLEMRDAQMLIDADSDCTVLPGMAFCVSVGFMETQQGKADTPWAIWLCDSVIVPLVAGQSCDVLTAGSSKAQGEKVLNLVADSEAEPATAPTFSVTSFAAPSAPAPAEPPTSGAVGAAAAGMKAVPLPVKGEVAKKSHKKKVNIVNEKNKKMAETEPVQALPLSVKCDAGKKSHKKKVNTLNEEKRKIVETQPVQASKRQKAEGTMTPMSLPVSLVAKRSHKKKVNSVNEEAEGTMTPMSLPVSLVAKKSHNKKVNSVNEEAEGTMTPMSLPVSLVAKKSHNKKVNSVNEEATVDTEAEGTMTPMSLPVSLVAKRSHKKKVNSVSEEATEDTEVEGTMTPMSLPSSLVAKKSHNKKVNSVNEETTVGTEAEGTMAPMSLPASLVAKERHKKTVNIVSEETTVDSEAELTATPMSLPVSPVAKESQKRKMHTGNEEATMNTEAANAETKATEPVGLARATEPWGLHGALAPNTEDEPKTGPRPEEPAGPALATEPVELHGALSRSTEDDSKTGPRMEAAQGEAKATEPAGSACATEPKGLDSALTPITEEAEKVKALLKLDRKRFKRRIEQLASTWTSQADALLILTGEGRGASRDVKAFALHQWLFRMEFSEMLLVVHRSGKVVFFASGTKITYLRKLVSGNVVFLQRTRGFAGLDPAQVQRLEEVIWDGKPSSVLGVLPDENHDGAFAIEVMAAVHEMFRVQFVDCQEAVSVILAPKDEDEIVSMTKAAAFAQDMMNTKLLPGVLNVVDEDLKLTEESVCAEVVKSVETPEYAQRCTDELGLAPEDVDLVFVSLQSGKIFELALGARSFEETIPMHGSYLMSLGVKYLEYSACLARTMLVDPSPALTDAYKVALDVQKLVIGSLKHGAKFKDIFCAALQFVVKNKPELLGNFQRNVGWVMGLEMRDTQMLIDADSEREVLPGMGFCVSVGFIKTQQRRPDAAPGMPWAVWLCDSVVVPLVASQGCQVLTAGSSKAIDDISFLLFDANPAAVGSSEPPETLGSSAAVRDRTNAASTDAVAAKNNANASMDGGMSGDDATESNTGTFVSEGSDTDSDSSGLYSRAASSRGVNGMRLDEFEQANTADLRRNRGARRDDVVGGVSSHRSARVPAPPPRRVLRKRDIC
eukprot:TRINITY_DN8051_c0_g1_i6.p1 TRINITY_DN8051_c0_g1~~TRINITY_DN8051_c0_g1_i6.p1  ORF type:complete len:1302 (-),score=272.66 TRINITY_DN8051_c0_g1_i6:65-3970(-)